MNYDNKITDDWTNKHIEILEDTNIKLQDFKTLVTCIVESENADSELLTGGVTYAMFII